MLESIREGSQGIIAKVILGFIILTFAVAGVGDYTNSVDTSVAEVNGAKISQSDFDKSFQSQRNRMAQQYGEMFETLSADANYMAQFRQDVLNNLINEKVIEQSSAEMAIRVSDAIIKEAIRKMPEFQVDGVFDNSRYLAIIQQAGFYQSSDFRDYLRTEMTRTQLSQAVVASEFTLPYQAKALNALQNQTRDIKYATIKAAQFEGTVEVSDSEIAQYYEENSAMFENPEQVQVNYITLDVADIAKNITVSEDEISEYYKLHIAEFTKDEQRRISHILIEFGEDEVAAETQANDLLTRINNGEDFAELAKEFSADTFSGEQGGDLEWIERGAMDETFDTAAFELSLENNVSDVVKTDFGFHIIKLTEFKAATVQSFEDVADSISAKVSTRKAEEEFYSLLQQMTDLSYEFPDSLDDAAGAINVEIKKSPWLTRANNIAPFNNANVIEAAFSDLVVREQVNSDVITVSDTVAVVMHVSEYKDANTKPLAEVTEQITASLTTQKAAEKAQVVADELSAKYTAGTDISEELTSYDAEFVTEEAVTRFGGDVSRNIAQKAFTLAHPTEGALSIGTSMITGGDVALIEVLSVNEGASAIDENNTERQTSLVARSIYSSFVEALVAQAEVTVRSVSTDMN